jgi:CRP-like cAMP-binding protein
MDSRETRDYLEFNSRLIAALAPYETVHVFERGTEFFRAGEEPKGIYVLLSGEVDLFFTSRHETAPLHFAVPGQILGLSSIVANKTHEYTATAVTTVLIGFIARDVFFKVLHDSPARWFDVLQVLSSDISSCYDRVKQLVAGGHVSRERRQFH